MGEIAGISAEVLAAIVRPVGSGVLFAWSHFEVVFHSGGLGPDGWLEGREREG